MCHYRKKFKEPDYFLKPINSSSDTYKHIVKM